MKGIFITLEGGECAGKTTQIPFIKAYFENKGLEVLTLREPGGTPCCEQIRTVLKEKRDDDVLCDEAELLLMYASRAQLTKTVIKPALAKGKVIVCDRYDLSTLAYQGAGRGIKESTIKSVRQAAIGDFAPDLTLLFDVDVKLGMARAGKRGVMDRIESSGNAFFERVRAGFLRYAKEDPEHIKVIDASLSPDEISAKIKCVLDGIYE